MSSIQQAIRETTGFLLAKGFEKPSVGIVLGTGLGSFVDKMDRTISVPYADIPHFPVSTVEFHRGNLVFGYTGTVPVVVMQGRFHYYEGYSMQQITFPVRVMKELGAGYLLLSNAAGGINPGYKKGDLVIIEDHINMLPDTPLRGMNDTALGNRFADMSQPYDKGIRAHLTTAFDQLNIPAREGVYVAVPGPSLETRAEYRWLRNCGADMVGMSTVPEVITAAQMGMPCAAVSVITDECDPDHLQPVNIPEIIGILGKASDVLGGIFASVINKQG